MNLPLYDRNYNARKAVIQWVSAFLAFGPIPMLLHFFTVEYDLFQGIFVATVVVAVQFMAYFLTRRKRAKEDGKDMINQKP